METINYFDIGTHSGNEIQSFLDLIHPFKCNVYGFEAFKSIYDSLNSRFKDFDNVQTFNLAVSNKNGFENLYLAKGNDYEGNSIFSTKNNVDENDFVTVKSIKFSDWIKENVFDFKEAINIIRFNIEGAELYLIKDLIDSGLHKYFKVYLGSKTGIDILKCSEIADQYDKYNLMLKDAGIIIHQYCHASKKTNISDKELIKLILA